MVALQLTTQTTTLPFVEKDYSGRSIVFTARQLVIHSGKTNGVVCAHVKRNAPQFTITH